MNDEKVITKSNNGNTKVKTLTIEKGGLIKYFRLIDEPTVLQTIMELKRAMYIQSYIVTGTHMSVIIFGFRQKEDKEKTMKIKEENGHIWKTESILDKRDCAPKKVREVTYRPMSIDEVKALHPGRRTDVYSGYANALLSVTVNGSPKTWKTRPNDVTVPVKYGLYEYARIEYADGAMVDNNLYFIVVP